MPKSATEVPEECNKVPQSATGVPQECHRVPHSASEGHRSATGVPQSFTESHRSATGVLQKFHSRAIGEQQECHCVLYTSHDPNIAMTLTLAGSDLKL